MRERKSLSGAIMIFSPPLKMAMAWLPDRLCANIWKKWKVSYSKRRREVEREYRAEGKGYVPILCFRLADSFERTTLRR
jgi:hypothetical protein